ncbi:hypothetical protein LguiA_007815 [Lonicera macranthoides]
MVKGMMRMFKILAAKTDHGLYLLLANGINNDRCTKNTQNNMSDTELVMIDSTVLRKDGGDRDWNLGRGAPSLHLHFAPLRLHLARVIKSNMDS